MKYIDEDYLFVEKYRPRSIKDCILPDRLKNTFNEFVVQGEFPTLILAGGPGVGKTTVAKAMCHEAGIDTMILNGTMDGGIDKLRTDVTQFASTYSLMGGGGKKKVVIYDEADYLSWKTQPALRGFIEEFSSNCTFILTCNFINKIIEPLQSRSTVIDFNFTKTETSPLMMACFNRIKQILDNEKIVYDGLVIRELIKIYFPDMRRLLNELQRYSSSKIIDKSILSLIANTDITTFVGYFKDMNFKEIRKWIWMNGSIDYTVLYEKIFNELIKQLTPDSVPQMVLTIADYQFKATASVSQQINLLACCTQIMAECNFKK